MSKGDREMYKSVFERVYTERGREEGLGIYPLGCLP
jgi:hypothetical protein